MGERASISRPTTELTPRLSSTARNWGCPDRVLWSVRAAQATPSGGDRVGHVRRRVISVAHRRMTMQVDPDRLGHMVLEEVVRNVQTFYKKRG